MRFRLPSIGALTAFEAAARHLSITRAAGELALTESAVSRQISLLEEQLGVQLFHRVKKRIMLTRAGVAYSGRVAQMIERIRRDALEVMGYDGDGSVLEIAALPTVGAQWLIPRLPDFYERRPGTTVHVSARNNRFFFSESALDGALYFGQRDWPGTNADYLFDEVLVPVGSPRLLESGAPLVPEALVRLRLLHLATRPTAWSRWCETAGVGEVNVMRGPRFDIQSMLVSAACAGLGVALLPAFLITDQLRSGKLKVLSEIALQSEGAYYFAWPEDRTGDSLLAEFRAWLLTQADNFRRNSGMPRSVSGARSKRLQDAT